MEEREKVKVIKIEDIVKKTEGGEVVERVERFREIREEKGDREKKREEALERLAESQENYIKELENKIEELKDNYEREILEEGEEQKIEVFRPKNVNTVSLQTEEVKNIEISTITDTPTSDAHLQVRDK
jgi:Ser-tRNA(Ala) deacylase AlaX